jgi:hypothetical protein
MLSRTSFKADLAAYRASMKPPQKPGDRGPLGRGNLNTADAQLIERWIADGRAEKIWSALKRRRADAEPASFIRAVLAARRSAEATINRVYGKTWRGRKLPGFNDEWALALPTLKRKIGALSKNLGPLHVAAILNDAAQDLRDMHHWYFGSPDHAKFDLSRKDQGDSRRPKLFVQIMGDYFSRQFGAALHDHAVALAEIVVDRPLPDDFARNARRTALKRAERYIRK